jgi:hypothetical protein
MRDMYRKLNWQGGTPREVAEIVNNLVEGKSNNTGTITLASGGATSTTLYDERIGYNSVILFMPTSINAVTQALPYGAWQDSTDQVAANTTTAYPVTMNTTDFEEGVSLASGSRITAQYAGLYNIQFSLQLSNLANNTVDIDIWFRKNGTNINNSNSRFGMAPRKSSSDPYNTIAAMNFFVNLDVNDYVELMWSTSDIQATIEQHPTSTSPTRPAVPSVIVTAQYVSTNGYTSGFFFEPYVSSRTKGSAVISHPANTDTDKTYDYIVVA